ncbi:NAD(P)/FAD-dependent oxidoreductase [Algoriphagus halophytocola]|uniref:NAD(P)/FAD-dependent oxidoreductase n=1 Tax=Algoriphagus halophytocola TaxID=2991499 RepID=A0ABY6MKX9_9BACT|nr:NAD(P)/FAD-dependent oxidoreductase [Algoriphagus sp. TR-M5]UZD24411.1 NAD(P)/FAD-dependent oxidoreductase [Algoriphagus sp. TR-M5]
MESNQYEVIIIGGSYSGLAAAMALGRSLRKVLVIDAGKPCNRQTPHSHNFLTQDGKTPLEISSLAKQQVEAYETVSFLSDYVLSAKKSEQGFQIKTQEGDTFESLKLIFATGIRDILPDIPGLQECWGISVIHCPYCHGYEVRNEKTGILANGDFAFEFGKMITNWTKELTLYTNGKSTLTPEQTEKLISKNVPISEKKISRIIHQDGKIKTLVFQDGSRENITALYAKPDFEQSTPILSELGCALKENGYLEVDQLQRTSFPGVFACGDNINMFRSVAFAVSSGSMAGAACNKDLIDESF